MSENKTTYVGSGRKQSDTWLKVTINPEKLADFVEEYANNKFVRLNINIKDQPDQYGKDVSVSIDQWKPDNERMDLGTGSDDYEEDLPF